MFDFEFFQNDQLVSKFEGLNYSEETFVTEEVIYNHNEKKLSRETNDYQVEINFNNEIVSINLINENYRGDIKLLKSNINEKDNVIEIIYQIDSNEPINKILITRRNHER